MTKRTIDARSLGRLQEELSFLRQQNLVTSEQSAAIIDAYEPQNDNQWQVKDILLLGLTSLGVLMLGMSIFLLLSFNWKYLAPCWKMSIVLGALGITWFAATTARSAGRKILSELLYFGEAILFGVAIWQIAQIFHFTVYYSDGLWQWALGTAILAFFMRTPLLHLLTVVLLVIWSGSVVCDGSGAPASILLSYWELPNAAWTLPVFVLAGCWWAQKNRSATTAIFYVALLFWWACSQAAVWKLLSLSPYYLGGVAGLFYLAGIVLIRNKAIATAFAFLGTIMLFINLFFLSFYEVTQDTLQLGHHQDAYSAFLVLITLLGCYLLIGVLGVIRRCQKCKGFSYWLFLPSALGLLLTIGGILIASFSLNYPTIAIFACTMANLGILLLCAEMLQRGINGNPCWFWLGILGIIAWAIARYVDLFGDFGGMLGAAAMFFLVAMAIFASAWFWRRVRVKAPFVSAIDLCSKDEDKCLSHKDSSPLNSNEKIMGSPAIFGWMMGVIVALLIQLGVLGQMMADQIIPFSDAQEITVATVPVDPRDLFRGDYVTLNYEFSRSGTRWNRGRSIDPSFAIDFAVRQDQLVGRTVYVGLRYDEEKKLHVPVIMARQLPEDSSYTCVIKGVMTNYSTVRYGIENYYVQEGTGRQYEHAITDSEKKVHVHLLVAKDGRARIKGVEIINVDEASEEWQTNRLRRELFAYGNGFHWNAKQKLIDAHIHLRGGMTAEKAVERSLQSGIRSGVLENLGRDWPLSTNEKLKEFIEDAKKANTAAPKLLIGVQVNDRDWYEVIDKRLFSRLDYILADTMIMGVGEDGKPQKLWLLPEDYQTDKDQWFAKYLEHNLTVLEEPIDILANPTWLPKFIADDYDKYWTDENMMKIIDKAVANDIALEIQAESDYPKSRFIDLARKAGAKFSFGTNNFDDKLKSLDTWHNAIKKNGIEPNEFWRSDD